MNLEAISKAIDQHTRNCGFPILEVLMCPFEIDRLDWDQIRGIPINPDDSLGTGRFRLVCAGQHAGPVAPGIGEALFVDPPEQVPVEVPNPERVPAFV